MNQESQSSEQSYQCSCCGISFALKDCPVSDKDNNTGETTYKCGQCAIPHTEDSTRLERNGGVKERGKKFTVKRGKRAEIIQCEICQKTFTLRKTLYKHLAVHTGEKPFTCTSCGMSFSQKYNLSRHILVHTGEKPFSCCFCPKSFTLKRDLTHHIRTHTGEKPHKCSTCQKSFARSSDLLTHMRTHTGEMPYQCNFCSKRFRQQSNLKCHLRIHTSEKPYQCSICYKTFTDQSTLDSHCRKRHAGQKFYYRDNSYTLIPIPDSETNMDQKPTVSSIAVANQGVESIYEPETEIQELESEGIFGL